MPGGPWGPSGSSKPTKWILGGLAVLIVIVVSVVATLLIVRDDPRPLASPPLSSGAPRPPVDTSDIASAQDRRPVEIITEDPTCTAWTSISSGLAQEASKGWDRRDPSISSSDWTTSEREQYEGIAKAMRSAADQTIALVKLTPNRVIRELYEQSIAYWRAYAEKIPAYTATDDHLARTATGTSNSLVWICSAIQFGSADARAPYVIASPAPRNIRAPEDPKNPTRFLPDGSPVCSEWVAESDAFGVATSAWFDIDPNVPAAQWSPEQQATFANMVVIMQANADRLQMLGIRSGNPTFDDFAALAAQYRRAYVQSFATYIPEDTYLANAATELVVANTQACLAAGAA